MGKMFEVAILGGVVDQYIIKENKDKLVEERGEDIIHGALKTRSGIGKEKMNV